MKLITCFLAAFLLFSCKEIPYKDDTNYHVAAVLGSPEYLIYIGSESESIPCIDVDGIPGFCSKRIKRDQDFIVYIPKNQYARKVIFDCTNTVQSVSETMDVLSGDSHAFVIPAINYGHESVFNCTVQIKPLDRNEPINATARVSVAIVDEKWMPLEKPYIDTKRDTAIFGQYAYQTMYHDCNGWHYAKEKTTIKTDDKCKIDIIFVESYVMRGSAWLEK